MNRKTLLLSAFAILALGAIVYGHVAPRSSGGLSIAQDDDLRGNVRFEDGAFVIRNDDRVSWESCWATLNSEYVYPVDAPTRDFGGVGAGEEMQIPSHEFTTRSGGRFNALETRPIDFSLSCDDRFGHWEW